jgi:hypothetical protein
MNAEKLWSTATVDRQGYGPCRSGGTDTDYECDSESGYCNSDGDMIGWNRIEVNSSTKGEAGGGGVWPLSSIAASMRLYATSASRAAR